MRSEKPAVEPRKPEQYSNTKKLLPGKIVEKASGQNYFDYVRENIYKRAGMTDTDACKLDRVIQNLAVGYAKEFTDKGVEFSNSFFLHVIKGGAACNDNSTARDLLKFSVALV